MRTADATFQAIGCTHRVLATEAAVLEEAVALVRAHLAQLDLAASRFRADSEVTRLALSPDGRAVVSPLLREYVEVALRAAAETDGLVDPTTGWAVSAAGYDRDLGEVHRPVEGRADVPGWESVHLEDHGIRVEPGTLLDLGATAKAHAADRLAAGLAARLPGRFLVDLGGDVAVSGTAPGGGWRVGVELADGRVPQVLTTYDSAVATSSTRLRRWRTDLGERHHVVDPRDGGPAPDTWASVTCVAPTAREANQWSTAAIVLGREAPAWLAARGVPARLDTDRFVVVTPGWPQTPDEWLVGAA